MHAQIASGIAVSSYEHTRSWQTSLAQLARVWMSQDVIARAPLCGNVASTMVFPSRMSSAYYGYACAQPALSILISSQ